MAAKIIEPKLRARIIRAAKQCHYHMGETLKAIGGSDPKKNAYHRARRMHYKKLIHKLVRENGLHQNTARALWRRGAAAYQRSRKF